MLACAIRRSAGLPVVSSNDDENDWVCHFVTQPQDRWQQHQSRGPRRPEQGRPGISKPARRKKAVDQALAIAPDKARESGGPSSGRQLNQTQIPRLRTGKNLPKLSFVEAIHACEQSPKEGAIFIEDGKVAILEVR